MSAEQNFRVDLQGLVDLLSHHLYSGPGVYLRELVQNSVDAITARRENEPEHRGTIRITPADASDDGALCIADDGVGLDEAVWGLAVAGLLFGASWLWWGRSLWRAERDPLKTPD